MVDSLQHVVQAASMIPMDKIISAFFALGAGSAIGAKIIWKFMMTPKHCNQHDELYRNVLETRNDVKWLVEDYKRRNV